MSIAATLRLADHIQAGATRLEDLAERTGADPDAFQLRSSTPLATGNSLVELGS